MARLSFGTGYPVAVFPHRPIGSSVAHHQVQRDVASRLVHRPGPRRRPPMARPESQERTLTSFSLEFEDVGEAGSFHLTGGSYNIFLKRPDVHEVSPRILSL